MCNCASCAQVNEVPSGHCDYWEGTLFLQLHIYYAYFTSAQLEQSVCCRLLMTHDHHLYYVPWLQLDEDSLVQWYHQCPPQVDHSRLHLNSISKRCHVKFFLILWVDVSISYVHCNWSVCILALWQTILTAFFQLQEKQFPNWTYSLKRA